MIVNYDDDMTWQQIMAIERMLETEFRKGEWVTIECECSLLYGDRCGCGGTHPFISLQGNAEMH